MRPLEGIRIIDFTTYAAGPSATRILADMGADVIKVEPPCGEAFRVWGRTNHLPIDKDENPAFELDNINKRGIAVDVKSEDGLEIIHHLLKNADAFVTNYRQSALERMHLTYEDIHSRYPRVVYAFCSGYGSKGPRARAPGFDYVAYWGRGGVMEATGEPGGEPAQIIPAGGDQVTGAMLAGAVAVGLVGASRTGVGQKLEVSLYQSALWLMSPYLLKGYYGAAGRTSRKDPTVPLLNVFKCRDDRWIAIAILEHERYWESLCKAVGLEHLLEDERFVSFKAAQKNAAELTKILDDIMMKKTVEEWECIFDTADIACQRLFTAQEINEDPQALENDYLKPFTFRSGNTINITAAPFQVTSEPAYETRPAPCIGEHTDEVLKEMGYSDEKIRELRECNVIR